MAVLAPFFSSVWRPGSFVVAHGRRTPPPLPPKRSVWRRLECPERQCGCSGMQYAQFPSVALAHSLSCLANVTTCMYHIGAGSPTWGPGPSREAFVCTSEGTDQDVRAFWCGNVCSVAYPPRAYFLSDVPLSPKPRRGFCHLAEGVVFPWAFAYVASFLPFQNHPQHLLMQVSLHVFLSYACVLYSSSPLMGTMEFTLPVYDFTAPSSFKEWCQ